MKSFRLSAVFPLMLSMTLLVIAACSSSTDNGELAPIDTTPPTVLAHFPASDAAGVTRSGPYWILFNRTMDEESVENGTTVAPGSIYFMRSWSGDTLFLTPTALLEASALYTITVSGSCEALNGTPLGIDMSFSFTTDATVDETPPAVVSTSPANGEMSVGGADQIEISFSEAMNDWATRGAIGIVPAPADQWMEWQATTLVVHHSAFPQNSDVTVTISTDAQDLSGNHLASPVVVAFHTRTDTTRPVLVSAAPANGATGVSTGLAAITLTFSEGMDPSSFEMPSEAVDARINQAVRTEPEANDDFSQLTVMLSRALAPGCTYWVDFLDVTDGAGNPIDPNPTHYRFTTGGTVSYFPAKSDATWLFERDGSSVSRVVESYNQAAGTFNESFYGESEQCEGTTYFKKTSSEIQHLGRSNYEHGEFQFTMMWDSPLPYIKLPLSSHLGDSWSFATTSSIGDTIDISLTGHIEIEAATVDLVSPTLHGTFAGCYVHHLYADLVLTHDGNPVDEQHVHQIMWLAPGVGPVQIVDQGGYGADTLRVGDWNSLY